MPWIEASKPPGEQPARYILPEPLCDDIILGRRLEYAKNQRKHVSQIREVLLATQKVIGREDRDGARYLGELAAELLKQFRGWDFVVKYMECDKDCINWRTPTIQKEIAPYADMAFFNSYD